MTITTYAELKTAIGNWMARSDLTSYLDEFIDLAEAWFDTELRCREMEASTDITPSSNVYALPSDFLEARRVVEKASIRRRLEYISPDVVKDLYPARVAGLSTNWTIIGSSLYTFPLSSNDVELVYYQKIPALSGSNTTNWLLTRMPGLYLAACKAYANEFIMNREKAAQEFQIARMFIDNLHGLDNRANYSTAGMTMSFVTP